MPALAARFGTQILLFARSHVNRVLPDFSHVKRETGSDQRPPGVVPAVFANASFTDQNFKNAKGKKKDSRTPETPGQLLGISLLA